MEDSVFKGSKGTEGLCFPKKTVLPERWCLFRGKSSEAKKPSLYLEDKQHSPLEVTDNNS